MDYKLAIEKITKTFNKGEFNEIDALMDINLNFNSGENVIIIGHNGSGKSTLLNIIDGRIEQTAGSVRIDGKDLNSTPTHLRAKYLFRLFQESNHGVVPMATIRENLAMAKNRGTKLSWVRNLSRNNDDELKSVLSQYRPELTELLDKKVFMLSPGERQAVVLACLSLQMGGRQQILLADEPTASLDPDLARLCVKTISDYSKSGWLCLTITHEPESFIPFSSRVIRLAKGRLIEDERTGGKEYSDQ